VVAEAVGQNAEYIVHGESGLLTPSGDAEAMAEACLCLLRDAALRERLGAAARERMRARYAWPALARRVLAAYGG
jgi:glycosyltransferase involved in cell wall biosynthesis